MDRYSFLKKKQNQQHYNGVLLIKNELLRHLEQNQGREGFCSTVVSGGAHSKAANAPLAGSCTRLPSTPRFSDPSQNPLPASGRAERGGGAPAPPRKARAHCYGAGPARPSEPGGRRTRRSRGGGAGNTTTNHPRALLSRAREEGPGPTLGYRRHNGR